MYITSVRRYSHICVLRIHTSLTISLALARFLWGDIFYVISSIMFTLQPIFQMYADPDLYTYERDCNYYFVTNVVMLVDASCYSIGIL